MPAGQEDHCKDCCTEKEHGAFEHELQTLTAKIVVCFFVDHGVPDFRPCSFS